MAESTKKTLYKRLSEARRKQGITQSELARRAACKQSAVSMMERGRPDALAWDKITKISDILQVDISEYTPPTAQTDDSNVPVSISGCRVCPVYDCPSNLPYMVNGQLFILPRITGGTNDKHCAYCGELLESHCPDCGAPITSTRACCGECGSAYIAVPDEENSIEAWETWAQKQRFNLKELGFI